MSAEIDDNQIRLPPKDDQQRLRRAVAELPASVVAQREMVAARRAGLARLPTAMQGLVESLQQYRSNLERVGTQPARISEQAGALEPDRRQGLVPPTPADAIGQQLETVCAALAVPL